MRLRLATSGTIIDGAAIVIPPANIIVISVRLVNLRPISLFMLLVIFPKNLYLSLMDDLSTN